MLIQLCSKWKALTCYQQLAYIIYSLVLVILSSLIFLTLQPGILELDEEMESRWGPLITYETPQFISMDPPIAPQYLSSSRSPSSSLSPSSSSLLSTLQNPPHLAPDQLPYYTPMPQTF